MERKNSDQSAGGMGIMVEGKGSSQGTCIKDPWTWTAGRGLNVGGGSGMGRGGQWGKKWNNYNRVTIKKLLK